MTRPIIWALGVAVSAGVYATVASGRLATKFGLGGAQPTTAAAVADAKGASPVSADKSGEPRTLVLNADLRGHYAVHAMVDGLRVKMLVDTGATYLALSYEDAVKAGIRVQPRDFKLRMSTANGVSSAAPVKIAEVKVGDIVVRNVDAVVCSPGALGTSLLGMSFLRKLGAFEMSQGRLTLRG